MKLLLLIVVAFEMMLGLLRRSRAFSLVSSLLLVPLLWIFIRSAIIGIWGGLSGSEQMCVIIFGLPLVLFGLLVSTTFGREVVASFFGDALFTFARAVVLLPFRLIRAIVRWW